MKKMTPEEWRAFMMDGMRTGKLATVRKDGRPRVTPLWFVLDGDDDVFNTARTALCALEKIPHLESHETVF
jgi:predicted pyridoxine 5'-phosphate oxidase superfamily flavin-nucleotide-binding protein